MNNFGKDHPCKFFLDFKISSSKVATPKQILDYVTFGFSQINSILHPTTNIVSQILFESLPPKRIAQFKNSFLSAITSNTWCALIHIDHTLLYPEVLRLNHHTSGHH
jgi:hypothetical protein